jgi:hypothetical protein
MVLGGGRYTHGLVLRWWEKREKERENESVSDRGNRVHVQLSKSGEEADPTDRQVRCWGGFMVFTSLLELAESDRCFENEKFENNHGRSIFHATFYRRMSEAFRNRC